MNKERSILQNKEQNMSSPPPSILRHRRGKQMQLSADEESGAQNADGNAGAPSSANGGAARRNSKARSKRRIRKLSEEQKRALYAHRPDLRPCPGSASEDRNLCDESENDDNVHFGVPQQIQNFLMDRILSQKGEARGPEMEHPASEENKAESCVPFEGQDTLSMASAVAINTTQYVQQLTECAEVDLIQGSLEWTNSIVYSKEKENGGMDGGEYVAKEETPAPTNTSVVATENVPASSQFSISEGSQMRLISPLARGVNSVKELLLTMVQQESSTKAITINEKGHELMCGDIGGILSSASSSSEEGVSANKLKCKGEINGSHINAHMKRQAKSGQGHARGHRRVPSLTDVLKSPWGKDKGIITSSSPPAGERTPTGIRGGSSKDRLSPRKRRSHRRGQSFTDLIKARVGRNGDSFADQADHTLDSLDRHVSQAQQAGKDKRSTKSQSLADLVKSTVGLDRETVGTEDIMQDLMSQKSLLQVVTDTPRDENKRKDTRAKFRRVGKRTQGRFTPTTDTGLVDRKASSTFEENGTPSNLKNKLHAKHDEEIVDLNNLNKKKDSVSEGTRQILAQVKAREKTKQVALKDRQHRERSKEEDTFHEASQEMDRIVKSSTSNAMRR